MMKYLTLLVIMFTANAFAADFEAQALRLKDSEERYMAAREAAFRSDLEAQDKALNDALVRLQDAREYADALRKEFSDNEKVLAEASENLRIRTGNLGEMFGVVRQVAGDLRSITNDSLTRADGTGTPANLEALSESRELPRLRNLRLLWQSLRQEAQLGAEVRVINAPLTAADGTTTTERAYRIGAFNIINEQGYLIWDPELDSLRAVARQPHEASLIGEYLVDPVAPIAIDPSRGALLTLSADQPTLLEHVRQGGLVGYLIMILGVAGSVIALWRLVALSSAMRTVRVQLGRLNAPDTGNPLGRIILASREASADDASLAEARLDEAVLRELPAIERGQSVIKLLAGVAPLLGLLGTVTGMIATFQTITVYGSGDAKLMAGGISQALVTTELGLIVAVPLLLLHAWVASRSRAVIHILDEQSAGLLAESIERSTPAS